MLLFYDVTKVSEKKSQRIWDPRCRAAVLFRGTTTAIFVLVINDIELYVPLSRSTLCSVKGEIRAIENNFILFYNFTIFIL